MRIQRGPGGMNFEFHEQPGDHNGRQGMPQMPFFFGRPGGQQQDGGCFEFRMPQFRFQMPGNGDDANVPDAQPGYATQGA